LEVEIGDTLIQLAEAADLDDSIALCRALARKPRKGEDREKLRSLARKLVERFPDDASLYIAVGTMLLRSGTLGEAHETMRHIKRAFPEDDHVHELLGEVLMRMGDARGAVIAFERSLTVAPNIAVEEVLVEARVLGRTQDVRGAEATAAEAREILGDASEPLAVRRRGLSDKKTPLHDVRSMVDGMPGRLPTPSRNASYRPRAITGPAMPSLPNSGAPPARSSIAPSGSIPPPALDMPLLRARVEEPVFSRRTWMLGAAAGVLALGAGGALAVRAFRDGIGLDHAVVDLAVEAMLTAKPSQLDRATALLRRALVGAPRSSEAGVRAMQVAVLSVLDGQESTGGLDAAIEEAKARGASALEVASGEAMSLLLRGDAAGAKTRLEGVEPAGSPIDAVALHLVRGIVLERVSDATAIAAYEAALAAEPKAVAAALRIARARIAEGDAEGAAKAIETIAALGDTQRPLASALETLARATGLALGGAVATSAPPPKLGDDLPKSLKGVDLALAALASSDAEKTSAMFGAAILSTETATDAALLGLVALRRGLTGSAAFASSRAAELGAGDPSGAYLAALVAYVSGDLARVESTAKRLPERLAATCGALLAYEGSDLAALRAALPKVAATHASTLQLAVTRLAGERALETAELASLAQGHGFLGQIVSIDGSLDRGDRADLDAAAAILHKWPTDERGPVRAARAARLSRLRDDVAGARVALRDAANSMSPATLLEAILVRDKSDAATLRARVETSPEATRAWLSALERATAKDSASAKKITKGLALPDAEAATTLRMIAALALASTGEGANARPILKQLGTLWPANADVRKAMKRAGGGGEEPAAVVEGDGGAYE